MKKNLYKRYIDDIRLAMRNEGFVSGTAYGFDGTRTLSKGLISESLGLGDPFNSEPLDGMHELAKIMGIPSMKPATSGDHPDFVHLREKPGYENHYIASVFMDVKNSTGLHRKYKLEQSAFIIQRIIEAAIHTCGLFGGHIARQQYDGVFAYFGGKNVTKEQAVQAAINAASFFSYFVRFELRPLLEEDGIEGPVNVKTGIDFGDDHEVMWLILGTPHCNELTTHSLHTSLAPKMQEHAPSDGIMIGDNVKRRLQLDVQELADYLKKDGSVDETKRYIWRDSGKNFNYSQYSFDWQKYLRRFDFVKIDEEGKLYFEESIPQVSISDAKRIAILKSELEALEKGKAGFTKTGQVSTDKANIIIPPSNRNYYNDKSTPPKF